MMSIELDANAKAKLETMIDMQIKQVLDKINEEGESEEEAQPTPIKNSKLSMDS